MNKYHEHDEYIRSSGLAVSSQSLSLSTHKLKLSLGSYRQRRWRLMFSQAERTSTCHHGIKNKYNTGGSGTVSYNNAGLRVPPRRTNSLLPVYMVIRHLGRVVKYCRTVLL